MIDLKLRSASRATGSVVLAILAGVLSGWAQTAESAAIVSRIDAAAQSRYDHVLGFTDIENYAIYRSNDEAHAAASMTVKTTYRKGEGKSYQILSESGSGILLHFGLHPLLENEKAINVPSNVEKSWFTSANYDMKLKPGVTQQIDSRSCLAIAIIPRRKASNTIDGTLWVDAKDALIVKVEGVASKDPSVFSGTTHMMRQYSNIEGYSMSKHARAESNSSLFGPTVVTIDYGNYHLQTEPDK
ncbi:MAG: hypothetical protein ABSD70_11560 [Terracidiphilus sp.]